MTPQHDYSQCGGPEQCLHCRAILTETPHEAVARMTNENAMRALQHSSAWRNHIGRMVQGYGCIVLDTPDPYAAGLAKLREENAPTEHQRRALAHLHAEHHEDTIIEPQQSVRNVTPPPDPYAEGIAKMRRTGR